MAKKQEQVNEIVENEPVVINEKDIISGEELKETDVIDVNTPEITIETEAEEKAKAEEEAKAKAEAEKNEKADANIVKLKVLIAFTDKYTDQEYKVNDVISVEEERAKELLADPRRLVEKLK